MSRHSSRLRSITLGTLSIATIGLTLANVETVKAVTSAIVAGTDGADELIGTPDDDTINGRGGADVMTGLAGNDTYIVNDEADQVVEQADEGTDTVRVFGFYVLPPFVENLIVAGSQSGGGGGNDLANRMIGNSGSNSLNGMLGNDILTGRGGSDSFRFTTAPNASNVDRVTDFNVGEDSFVLSHTAFPEFRICTIYSPFLDPPKFHIGASATTAKHRIVHNPSKGVLYYDSDGSGSNPAVRFATLSLDLPLTSNDFLVQSRSLCP